MAVVSIQTPGARVSLVSERLHIESINSDAPQLAQDIPLAEVERLVLGADASITTPAMRELLRLSVPIVVLDGNASLLGSFEPGTSAHAGARIRQYRAVTDPSFNLRAAQRLVEAKISNGRRVLQRLQANHPRLEPVELAHLQALHDKVATSTSLDELRGIEGAASAAQFGSWARFLPEAFPFERRTRRPPHNPVNACLSYLATILYGECLSACHATGLDPGLGCLHVPEDGRWALALDLMEPFRPILVESLTLRLFAWRVLGDSDFEPRNGGIYLNPRGRRSLWHHYEQRMTREFHSEHAGCRTTLRAAIAQAASHFKVCLQQPELFNPFRIN